jgi:uncharacterized damage-inducible protein DinB
MIKQQLTQSKLQVFALGAMLLLFSSAAPSPGKGGYDWLKGLLEATKAYTLEVFEAMPESDFDFQPNEEQRTFKAQAYHITYSIDYFRRTLSDPQAAWNPGDENSKSKKELIQWASEQFDAINKAILDAEVIDARSAGIVYYLDHNSHHRGQMVSYLRLKGIKPPANR